jgi:hypothetical protein
MIRPRVLFLYLLLHITNNLKLFLQFIYLLAVMRQLITSLLQLTRLIFRAVNLKFLGDLLVISRQRVFFLPKFIFSN